MQNQNILSLKRVTKYLVCVELNCHPVYQINWFKVGPLIGGTMCKISTLTVLHIVPPINSATLTQFIWYTMLSAQMVILSYLVE